ncbi:MAG: TerC family protein [Deltaproteobacteria bacterium]|nr:TerC family protein [Deltaproteobacteria bacterium]
MENFSFEILWALLTLTLMEIVLGIDNIVFVSIVSSKTHAHKKNFTRNVGIILALILRLGLLFTVSWIMGLQAPWIKIFSMSLSGRDMILMLGGLFLIYKATMEIHEKIEDAPMGIKKIKEVYSVPSAIFQILMLDLVFSLDSVITAVGMVKEIWIMVVAMVVAMFVMLFSAKSISDFVENNPTIKILALAFLLLIGVLLLMEGLGQKMDKGYIYFAMAFSLAIELINMRIRNQKNKAK